MIDSCYSLFFVSMIMVTGPSLTRATFMSAPKVPVLTCLPVFSDRDVMKYSYSGMACSGRAALIKEGRLPFLYAACSVNWLTRSISPFTSLMSLFINPFSSLKTRRSAILPLSQSASSLVSSVSMPSRTKKPLLIDDFKLPSMVTLASDTRWMTALIFNAKYAVCKCANNTYKQQSAERLYLSLLLTSRC